MDLQLLQQWLFFAILLFSFLFLLTEWLPNDVIAILIILALAFTRILDTKEVLAGFGSEPAIIAASIFVMNGAFHYTGLSEKISGIFSKIVGDHPWRITTVIMGVVAFFSAFTHHITTTAIMLPVTLRLSREKGVPASKLLMPLAMAASLGTTMTIIGAPAFLVASKSLEQAGRDPLGMFSITPLGILLNVAAILFILTIGRFLLPSREGVMDEKATYRSELFLTELTIEANSAVIGKTLVELKPFYHFTVARWLRDGQPLHQPFHDWTLKAHDVLIVHIPSDDLATLENDRAIKLRSVKQFNASADPSQDRGVGDERIVQTVVASHSEFVGKTLRQIDFRRRFGGVVIALWRQAHFLEEELGEIPLVAGDVLLIYANAEAISRIQTSNSFLLISPFQGEIKQRGKSRIAALIMLITIILAITKVVPLEIAMLSGAAAAVLTGCLTLPQAYRSIDTRIYIFIAGAIPLGTAMQKTGTADLLAKFLVKWVDGLPEPAILFGIFLIVGLITQLMSDAATVALFAPIAIALANGLGHSPEAYALTTAFGAVAAFLAPMGHHGNLLVYGPGNYHFNDFVRVGGLLSLLLGGIVAFCAPLLF